VSAASLPALSCRQYRSVALPQTTSCGKGLPGVAELGHQPTVRQDAARAVEGREDWTFLRQHPAKAFYY